MPKSNNILTKTVTINDKEISFEIGRFAQQASAAVLVRSGDTVVHVTVASGRENPELGYFPLSVEYQEKLYASGIIKGSRWVKRDGRPTDDAVLRARLIDRSIRPLFPKNYFKEVQVIVTVLSYDQQNDADILALCGASVALSLSSIPFAGPIAAVRVGLNQPDSIVINPTKSQQETSLLDLVVSGSEEAIVMVEAGAKEVTQTQVLKALKLGHQEIKKIIAVIKDFVKESGQSKETVIEPKIDTALSKQVLSKAKTELDNFITSLQSGADYKQINNIEQAVIDELSEIDPQLIKNTIHDYLKETLRNNLFAKKIRPDGRTLEQIRPLSSQVGLLPRTHGSAMFMRGATQVLSITTLGSPSLEQLIEDLEGETTKRYIHHYSFPPFSVGETGRVGWPSRREVGHGALAERALLPVIPDKDSFPYTIMVVSECMSSNGSTSMASVCGSTLSLMDAGVPILKPVAGIAMGLIKQNDQHLVLTDIQGLEDHLGDMDFKVAGTKDGITALQMDIKISGIPFDVLDTALTQAETARLTVLDSMLKTLSEPRGSVSVFAPKVKTLHIPVDKIGELIGPGGKNIKKIIAETECEVDVDDNGQVVITGVDASKLDQAYQWIDGLTREIKVNEEFDGKIVRIENYGAFVELLPGRDGMVHVSRLSPTFVKNINDIVKLGDTLHVRVNDIDDQGRVSLSALTPEQEQQAQQNRPPRPPRDVNRRPPRRRQNY